MARDFPLTRHERVVRERRAAKARKAQERWEKATAIHKQPGAPLLRVVEGGGQDPEEPGDPALLRGMRNIERPKLILIEGPRQKNRNLVPNFTDVRDYSLDIPEIAQREKFLQDCSLCVENPNDVSLEQFIVLYDHARYRFRGCDPIYKTVEPTTSDQEAYQLLLERMTGAHCYDPLYRTTISPVNYICWFIVTRKRTPLGSLKLLLNNNPEEPNASKHACRQNMLLNDFIGQSMRLARNWRQWGTLEKSCPPFEQHPFRYLSFDYANYIKTLMPIKFEKIKNDWIWDSWAMRQETNIRIDRCPHLKDDVYLTHNLPQQPRKTFSEDSEDFFEDW